MTSRYDDCSCGKSSFAVWFCPGEVEVPIADLPSRRPTKEDRLNEGEFDPWVPAFVIVDERGAFWIKGRLTSQEGLFKALSIWFKSQRKKSQSDAQLVVETPPYFFADAEQGFQSTLKVIQVRARQNGIRLLAWGYPTDDLP
ncbi:MAG: hypothetical protein HGA87_05960 [Desulfobulbaceae bacterium]|nr:hypothetical protein [Desulfobulbaceae bacterium]